MACWQKRDDDAGVVMNLTEDQTEVEHSSKVLYSEKARAETTLTGLLKHQLWFRHHSRKTSEPTAAASVDPKIPALASARSPTSLSDTIVMQNGAEFWHQRGGSLSRRRNISVPELKGSTEKKVKSKYRYILDDSPTIPGRPAIKRNKSETPGHERSFSAPGFGREIPSTGVASSERSNPRRTGSPGQRQSPNMLHAAERAVPYDASRPLSPILSPTTPSTPLTAVPRSPAEMQSLVPSHSGVSFTTQPDSSDCPPPVPPKNVPAESKVPERSSSSAKRSLFSKVHSRKPSQTNNKMSPLPETDPQPPSRSPPSPPTSASQPTKSDVLGSPRGSPSRRRMGSPVNAPRKNVLRKQKSAPALPKSTPGSSAEFTPGSIPDFPPEFARKAVPELAINIVKKSVAPVNEDIILPPVHADAEHVETAIPSGLTPMQAGLVLPQSDKDIIVKQATEQAEQFEILGSKLVSQLSKELRATDERCEYLRNTYKSLRAGRTKLHNRMIAYLKSDALVFSKERLLKQQEALIELDASIDDWINKLERAEIRRLRLRQKLLEHIAASMTLASSSQPPAEQVSTPPRSPPQSMVQPIQPLRVPIERKDVESIKIYADSMFLFQDIEATVTKMCETC